MGNGEYGGWESEWEFSTEEPRSPYRIAAVEVLAALGRPDAALSLIMGRFRKALAEDDVNDVFSNVLLLTTLADPRARKVFPS